MALTKLLVSPVVALLTDLAVLDNLVPSQGEVDVIFDHPLEALLDPELSAQEDLVEVGSELWPYEEQFYASIHFCIVEIMLLTLARRRITPTASGHGWETLGTRCIASGPQHLPSKASPPRYWSVIHLTVS